LSAQGGQVLSALPTRNVRNDVLVVVGAMLSWLAFYELNKLVFDWTFWGVGINWVFLPAAVRLGAVLLFGWRGALGIILGSLLTSQTVFSDAPLLGIAVSIASGLSPLIAVRLTLRHFGVQASLAGLTSTHLIVCTVAYAFIIAVTHNFLFWGAGGLASPLQGLAPMFVGDLLGAFMVLYVIRSLIELFFRVRTAS